MTPAERANRPRWTGQGFEIWFFVVLVPGAERALWVRMTRFAHAGESDARVWAVVSDAGSVHTQRERLPVDALRELDEGGRPGLAVGESVRFLAGETQGRCGDVEWSLRFEAGDAGVQRVARVPGFVPVGTHANHPYAEAPVTGSVRVGERELSLGGGLLSQMHIWGTTRVEWLRWAWAPRFDDGGALELTGVAPKDGGGNLVNLWARAGADGSPTTIIDRCGLTQALRAKLVAPRPGVLHHVASPGGNQAGAGGRVVARVWARPETFAGWDYRQTAGSGPALDLHVAQSNLGHAELEHYTRVGMGWQPLRRSRSTCAALEFHGLPDYPEFRYAPWDAEGEGAQSGAGGREPPVSAQASEDPSASLGPGRWIRVERPARILALGLTFRAHARETASAADPVVFEVAPSAWVGLPVHGERQPARLLRPSSAALFEACERLDPGLRQELAGFGFLPAMLDYEVELALVFPEGLTRVEELSQPGRVAMAVANDLTARSLQILGEGQGARLDYWGAAKSLPGLAPTAERAWLFESLPLDRWPELRLRTRVNGELRQDASTSLLMETPRQMLGRILASAGPLPAKAVVLTGTPSGIAFTVPRWKRAVGERLLDRVGKLRAAIGGFTSSTRFLRPGDRVEVDAGPLGGFAHVVDIEPEVVPEAVPEPGPE
ncbi:hypothetical protein PPSIR1_07495 [Plesiocystis pacifica SIR-1]|uniref:Fumarylacetoacetase-like C-terminal domain-containing protein n=1 Tax=Plesiocystis pacifica SIR-1 TaxID=391625 RepID=A6GCP0_9BACT|nr:fumarylacetoacetate hydrolase family protein [Plesiocystis pacifica]EDM76392.1 hypothetical protein PPSIR1_07495 [Plesiocystis pacifica SIR-1]